MKARVKATGEVINVTLTEFPLDHGDRIVERYVDDDANDLYVDDDLDFSVEYESVEPNYWEKLKHQYAGMALQGMLSTCKFPVYSTEAYHKHNIANNAIEYATALIEKLKEEQL